jgi:hypothetical protein
MLSFGGDRTRELANRAFSLNADYMDVVKNHVERRKVIEQGFDDYMKYRVNDAAIP